MYIQRKPGKSGAFPPPQDSFVPGLLAFPAEFHPVFYTPDKQCAGFVTIAHDGETVTECTWNEAAYQAYLAKLPEKQPLTAAQRREAAYNEDRVIQWPAGSGELLTVTEAAAQWEYYAAEGGTETAGTLTAMIAAAKAEIRARYPDGE